MERRKKIRLRIYKDVRVNASVVAECLDLSEDGMYVYVSHNFVVGSIVDLGLSLGSDYINVSAKVLHSQPGIGFGVNFFDFPEEVKQKIESYVAVLADDS